MMIEKSRVHIAGFDYLRVAAAFSVVWIHGSDTNPVAKSFQTYTAFAVPCFFLMAIFLMQQSLSTKPDLKYEELVKNRMLRLFPAYLVWSLGYVLVRYIKRLFLTHRSFEVDWLSVVFFGGASYQLWFIPLLILFTLLFTPLMQRQVRCGYYMGSGTLYFLAGFLVMWLASRGSWRHPHPGYEMLGYMKGSIGYVFWGMGVWALWEGLKAKGDREESTARWNWVGVGIGSLLLALIALKAGVFQLWFVPLYSLGFFIASLNTENSPVPRLVRYLAPLAFGIYLVHGFFVEGFQTLLQREGINISGFGATSGIIFMSFCCSALLCIFLKRIRLTRWLVM